MKHVMTAAAAALGAGMMTGAASAEEAGYGLRTIVVSGLGEASATPDMAVLNIGVDAEGASAAEALRKNSEQMTATLKTLRDAGVESRDIQTSAVNVGARYDYSEERRPPKIIGYQATNSVTVKLRDLKKAGGVIDKTVGAGANRLDSFSLTLADPKPVLDEARKAAISDARRKAKLFAEAADIQLGEILTISDSYVSAPTPYVKAERMMAASAADVPIAPGESTTTASVTLVFAIR